MRKTVKEAFARFDKRLVRLQKNKKEKEKGFKLEIISYISMAMGSFTGMTLGGGSIKQSVSITAIVVASICLFDSIRRVNKKLTSIQNFLSYQNKINNLFFREIAKTIDFMSRELQSNFLSRGAIDTTIKNNFAGFIDGIKNKKISKIEEAFWSWYVDTREGFFHGILYRMLSGDKLHFVFKTIDGFELLAINCNEDCDDCYEIGNVKIIAEPSHTIDEYCDDNKNSEDFANTDYGYPTFKEYEINYIRRFLFSEGLIRGIRERFQQYEDELPDNITFEVRAGWRWRLVNASNYSGTIADETFYLDIDKMEAKYKDDYDCMCSPETTAQIDKSKLPAKLRDIFENGQASTIFGNAELEENMLTFLEYITNATLKDIEEF